MYTITIGKEKLLCAYKTEKEAKEFIKISSELNKSKIKEINGKIANIIKNIQQLKRKIG